MEKRFDLVDKRFEQVNEQFIKVQEQFEHVNNQFSRVQKQFEHVDDLLETIAMATNAHSTKVHELDENRGNHESRIGLLERSVARLNVKLLH